MTCCWRSSVSEMAWRSVGESMGGSVPRVSGVRGRSTRRSTNCSVGMGRSSTRLVIDSSW